MVRFLQFLLVGVLLIAAFAGYGFYRYRTPMNAGEQTVIIPPHTRAQGVVTLLHDQGLVPSLPVIALPLYLSGSVSALKAGEYQFEAGMSPQDIIARIAKGQVVIHKVTIIEGDTTALVRATLMGEPLLTGELPAALPEGDVLPQTVFFTRGDARAAVYERLRGPRVKLLSDAWTKRMPGLPFSDPLQALVLASIVEKETGIDSERPMVAAVFINRLKKGMMLQSDPTVVYGITHGTVPLGRALSRADLQWDTPYNSYLHPGLPPTPICNPGAKALEAVLNPAASAALYFVATGTGGHYFAATLPEHLRNVALYHQKITMPPPEMQRQVPVRR